MEPIGIPANFASAVFVDVETGCRVNAKRQGFDFPCANSKFVVQAGGGHLAEPEELHGYLVILALVSPASGPDKALLQHVNKVRGRSPFKFGSSFGLFGPAARHKVEAELGLLISKQHAPGTVPPRAGPPSLQRTSSATAPKSLGGSVAMRLYKGWMLGDKATRDQVCRRGSCDCAPKWVLLRRCPGSGTGLSTH